MFKDVMPHDSARSYDRSCFCLQVLGVVVFVMVSLVGFPNMYFPPRSQVWGLGCGEGKGAKAFGSIHGATAM